MDTSNFDIQEMVSNLARLRQERDDYKATMDEVVERAKDSGVFTQARDLHNAAQDEVAHLEEKIRGWAVADYKATGNKKPHPALQIRVNKVFEYATDAVVNWCENNLQIAVKHTVSVDNKLFEKTIARLDALPDFVKVTEEPKATIATDLSEYTWAGKKTEKDEELPF